jgi:hypothetical protein
MDSMPNRRRLARGWLEIYLVHLFLPYRYLILTSGLFLLLFAVAVVFMDPLAGQITFLPAIYPLLLSNSYFVVLYTARLGAWIGTVGRGDGKN